MKALGTTYVQMKSFRQLRRQSYHSDLVQHKGHFKSIIHMRLGAHKNNRFIWYVSAFGLPDGISGGCHHNLKALSFSFPFLHTVSVQSTVGLLDLSDPFNYQEGECCNH